MAFGYSGDSNPRPAPPNVSLEGMANSSSGVFELMCHLSARVTVTIRLDDDGREVSKSRSKVLFDPDVDPVTEKAVRYGNDWLFVSFRGTVYPIDASGRTTRIKRSWSMVSRDEQSEGWHCAGLQHITVHQDSGMLYSLMHKGSGDSLNDIGTEDGEEIWVFDLASKKRVNRFAVHDFRPPDKEVALKALHIDDEHWLAELVTLWLNSDEAKAAAEVSRKRAEAEQVHSSPISGPSGGSTTPGAKSMMVTQGEDPLLIVVANGGTYTANAVTGEFIGKLNSAPSRGNLYTP